MANVKISALPEKSTYSDNDYIPIDNGVITQKIAAANMLTDCMKRITNPTVGNVLVVNSQGLAIDSGELLADFMHRLSISTENVILVTGMNGNAKSSGYTATNILGVSYTVISNV